MPTPLATAVLNANPIATAALGATDRIPVLDSTSGELTTATADQIRAADTLAGTTLASNVVASSLTSLGVLSTLKVATASPASAAATGVAGTIAWDASYIYVCTATDTWKRVAISTWP